jgi:putative restriction endonuclease
MGKATRGAVLRQFDQLNVWSRGDQRAPHKPLLVLYALGRWSRGETSEGLDATNWRAELAIRFGVILR